MAFDRASDCCTNSLSCQACQKSSVLDLKLPLPLLHLSLLPLALCLSVPNLSLSIFRCSRDAAAKKTYWDQVSFPQVCVCFCVCFLCVMFCQRLLSAMLSTRTCCGKHTCMFKGEKLGQVNQSCFFAVRQRQKRAGYMLVTPFFVPVTLRILSEVLLDQHTSYHAAIDKQGWFMCGSLCRFHWFMTHTHTHIYDMDYICFHVLAGFFIRLWLFWNLTSTPAAATATECSKISEFDNLSLFDFNYIKVQLSSQELVWFYYIDPPLLWKIPTELSLLSLSLYLPLTLSLTKVWIKKNQKG